MNLNFIHLKTLLSLGIIHHHYTSQTKHTLIKAHTYLIEERLQQKTKEGKKGKKKKKPWFYKTRWPVYHCYHTKPLAYEVRKTQIKDTKQELIKDMHH